VCFVCGVQSFVCLFVRSLLLKWFALVLSLSLSLSLSVSFICFTFSLSIGFGLSSLLLSRVYRIEFWETFFELGCVYI